MSYSDELFLACGFERAELATYPEKIARYAKVDTSELEVGEKHCFTKSARVGRAVTRHGFSTGDSFLSRSRAAVTRGCSSGSAFFQSSVKSR